jgi:hypothetical protein
MFLKPIGLIILLVGGFALGRLKLTLRDRSVALAVLLVIVLQTALKLVLPHVAIEEFAQRHVFTAPGPFVLTGIALVETAGVWILVLLIRWTRSRLELG